MDCVGEGSALVATTGLALLSGAAATREKTPSSSISLVPFSLACTSHAPLSLSNLVVAVVGRAMFFCMIEGNVEGCWQRRIADGCATYN